MSDASPAPSPLPQDLPPGTVLGPDGKPCKVCSGSDWRSWSNPTKSRSKAKPATAALATAGAAAASTIPHSTEGDHSDCPVNIAQLGRATWAFLHTAAAYYPERPSTIQQKSMLSLLTSLPHTYPCSHCASHLGENLKDHPPDGVVSGRGALSEWLCQRHNDVNERLGKERFDCKTVDERWLTGPADGRCD